LGVELVELQMQVFFSDDFSGVVEFEEAFF
jgi:hypothetical protein